ncbi:Ig-like domain-containing protein [Methylobacterium sp. HMF5984]|uniref:Ig-like domain-containing protein n=1 Tax=Methylobacterium sp. HMF5984 TaxID=3367370 RepID=UPI0038542750
MTQTGVYVGNDPADFASYSKWVGGTPGNVLTYLNNDSWKAFDSSIGWATSLWRNTATPSIWSVPLTVWGTSLEQVATGDFNDHFLKAAQALAQTKASSDGNIYVRVGWEFNGSWMPWAANGHEAAFIKSFQNLVDTFRSVSDKFKFVWDTTNDGGNMNPEKAYPGDKYVDVIGTDVYYSTQWDGTDAAKGFKGEVTRTYGLQWQQDFAAAHGKATAISEWGVASDNAAPYVQAMTKWMTDHNMVYENYWDSNADYSGKLSTGANATAGAAYKSAISSLQGAATSSPLTAPTVAITSSGGLTNTLAVKLAGTVGLSDAGTTVHVLDGVKEIGTALVQADGKWSAAVSLLNQQGTHQITVTDTNAIGTGRSSSVSYTVDTVAPVVKLGLVQDTGTSSTDKITTNAALTGTAEAGAKVTLSEGTTALGSVTADNTGHWNFTPTGLKLGAHTILASQTDAAGNTGSDTFAFTLQNAPTVAITSSGGLTNTLAVKLAGTVGVSDAGTTVHVLDGVKEIGTALVQADGKWSAAVSLLNQQGSHQISASDTNAAGTGKSSSVSYTVDTVAPVVKLGLVQDTGTSSTDKITTNAALTGTAEVGAKVTLSEGTTALGSVTADSTGHWNFMPTGLKLGAHTILASQTDAAGNTGSDTFAFTLQNAPTVAITSSGGLTNTLAVKLAGTVGVSDAGTTVHVLDGVKEIGTALVQADGKWSAAVSLLNQQGSHQISASDTNAAGTGKSSSISYTVDTVAPVVKLGLVQDTGTSSTDKITTNAALTGTAEAGAKVTLSEGTTALGSVTADNTGHWNFTPTGLKLGAHTILASQTDAAGNTGSDTFAFTLQNAPTVAITSSGGLTNTLAVKLAGTVGVSDAGTTVHVLDGVKEIGTALVQADGKWSAAVSLLNQQGTHQITVTDTNAIGTGRSSSVSYTVDTVAPVVKLGLVQDTGTSSTDKITTNAALTGTAEAGAKVTLSEGTTALGSVTADNTGHWNFTPTGLKLGAHTILASQTDAAGNTGSDTFAFNLQNSAPTSTSVTHTVAQGYEVVTTETNRLVTDRFDFSWQRTGAEIVTKDTPGKTIDQHFNKDWQQVSAEIFETTQDGNRAVKSFYDSSWHLTHAEIDTFNILGQNFGSTHEVFDGNWNITTWMAYSGKHLDGIILS